MKTVYNCVILFITLMESHATKCDDVAVKDYCGGSMV